jgi:uncharacterized protein (DUF58 family)
MLLGVMLMIILLGAINYDNALAYLLAFLLTGLFMVAMLHTFSNLAGLRFVTARAAPVFAGETALFECVIDNDSPRPRLALVLKHWPGGVGRERRRYLAQFESHCDIPGDDSGVVQVAVDAGRRGYVALERLALHSHYPLGILRAWAYFSTDARCLVYPRPHGRLPLPYARSAATGSATASTDGTDDFAGMRAYGPGDPVRAIAWKTLAKEQELMVKRFQGQAAAELWFTWDAVAGIELPEARLSQLTQWILEAEQHGADYALELPGVRIEPGRGPTHRDACLRELALFEVRA